jgi:hypothetical protein
MTPPAPASPTRDVMLAMSPKQLRAVLAAGHAIDPAALPDSEYRGISLGLWNWVERLAWKTFVKTFHRDPETGALRGWNVRIQQDGLDAPPRPRLRNGNPICWGYYQVVAPDDLCARHNPRGLMIHYGVEPNPRLDPARRVRDPLVALDPGSVDRLLGYSYVDLGFALPTPSYFLLERVGPLSYVPGIGS